MCRVYHFVTAALLVVFIAWVDPARAELDPQQVEVLKAIQDLSDHPFGPNWENWVNNTDPCEDGWAGVLCTGDQTSVRSLTRFSCDLEGALPATLIHFVDLEELDLSENELTSIPDISGLNKLRVINLRHNDITTSFSVAAMTNLEQIDLIGNPLKTVPTGLTGCSKLETVYMGETEITTFPAVQAGQLPALTLLELSGNRLVTFPSVTEATNLLELYLDDCGITNVPTSIEKLAKLTYLHMNENAIHGPFPHALTSLKKVVELDMQSCHITSLDAEINKLTTLKRLNINNNDLVTLPETLFSMSNLNDLSIRENKITHLPNPATVTLTKLRRLDASFNALTGIPSVLAKLEALETLILSNNELSQDATSTLTSLSPLFSKSLTGLYLGNTEPEKEEHVNKLHGPLPTIINDFSPVGEMELFANMMSGPLPDLSGTKFSLKIQGNHFRCTDSGGNPDWCDTSETVNCGVCAPLPILKSVAPKRVNVKGNEVITLTGEKFESSEELQCSYHYKKGGVTNVLGTFASATQIHCPTIELGSAQDVRVFVANYGTDWSKDWVGLTFYKNKSSNQLWILGVVLGCVGFTAIVILGVFFYQKKRKRQSVGIPLEDREPTLIQSEEGSYAKLHEGDV